MIKQLLSCVGEYRKPAILTPLFVVGEVAMELLMPLVMASIIDTGIQGDGGIRYTILMGLLMAVMAAASLCFGALAGKFCAVASTGFAKNVRNRLFDRVQDFSFSNVDRYSTASLVTRLTTDVTNTQNAFMMSLRLAVRAPVMFIGALFMAILISPDLSSIFLFVLPVLVIAVALLGSVAFPRFREMLRQYDAMNASVQENLIGIRVVKAFVRERHETEKFRERADAVRRAQIAAEKIMVLGMPIMQLCMYGCIVAVLWLGGKDVIGGELELGQLSSFLQYIMQILMSLMMVCMIFIMLVLSRASVSRIAEIFSETPDIRDDAADAACTLADGSVSFEDVSFRSDTGAGGEDVLSHISLQIASGQTVGIIGGTGSAKTTLVQLIPRLYEVTSGTLKVGGRPVAEYPLQTLRNAVAMVLQKNVLFSGTIRENLRWGNEHATDAELEEACRAAQAHEFISSFPDGYDTELGQGGVNVSGGQKQRLCIARALLKKPKILILDDSTSAVDTATDSKIRTAFRDDLHGTTVIMIAQRITSVMDADQIVVLDDGKISACGTHETLMQTSEIYREVYESQQRGEA